MSGPVQPMRHTCLLCERNCTDDAISHGDCEHGFIVCSVCAVQTCDDCVDNQAIVAKALQRDPTLQIRVNPAMVERLNEKLDRVALADIVGSFKMFMRAPVPCGGDCTGSMMYVEGSERWPSESERTTVPDAVIAYDRRCTVCGRTTASTIGDIVPEGFEFDDHDLHAPS